MKNMLDEFNEFALKGNLIELAQGTSVTGTSIMFMRLPVSADSS